MWYFDNLLVLETGLNRTYSLGFVLYTPYILPTHIFMFLDCLGNFAIFVMFFITVHSHVLMQKFSRGLTREIRENKTTAKLPRIQYMGCRGGDPNVNFAPPQTITFFWCVCVSCQLVPTESEDFLFACHDYPPPPPV